MATFDLALEGGGVKGIALVGAVDDLLGAGHDFDRVAGTSAGGIVAALVAAGATREQLATWVRDVDYEQFRDKGLLERLGPLGAGASLLVERGVYEGDALRRWLADRLDELGVSTFGDLRRGDDREPSTRFRLVVTAVDLSVGRLVRLPWDYEAVYGLDPDEQSVADAVRASTAIPYFYEPEELVDADGRAHVLVDGGLLANYPIDLFAREDDVPADRLTVGVKLSAEPEDSFPVRELGGPRAYAETVVTTALAAQDRRLLTDPCVVDRTVFIDTAEVSAIDFDLSVAQREELYADGRAAAASWRARFDGEHHMTACARRH